MSREMQDRKYCTEITLYTMYEKSINTGKNCGKLGETCMLNFLPHNTEI